jgi:hypothetical protein
VKYFQHDPPPINTRSIRHWNCYWILRKHKAPLINFTCGLLKHIVPGWRYLLGYNRLSYLIFRTLFPDHRRCYNRSITITQELTNSRRLSFLEASWSLANHSLINHSLIISRNLSFAPCVGPKVASGLTE